MKYIILGKNIEVTDGLRAAVEDKIGKLEKYFTPETEVHVTLSVEKDRQKIEVTIPVKGSIIRSEQVSNDMYVSIDLVEEIIERQLKKYKKKLTDQKQAASFFKQDYIDKDFMDINKENKFKDYIFVIILYIIVIILIVLLVLNIITQKRVIQENINNNNNIQNEIKK